MQTKTDSMKFITALKQNNLEAISECPKADLHNHFITSTSNYMLGRVADLRSHPIAELYRAGVDVTINSDDVLIFDSDVSKEYLRMYRCGCLSEEELDDIRLNGLRRV